MSEEPTKSEEPKNVQPIRKYVSIKPSQLDESSQIIQRLALIALPNQTIEDLKDPKAWATVSHKILPWARIDVTAEDGSWVAELFVVSVSRQWVEIEVLSYKEFQVKEYTEEEAYLIKWRGPVLKWCVVRKEDDSCIADKLTKEDALRTKIQHEKAIGM